MAANRPYPVEALFIRRSELYVGLEDFTEDRSMEALLKVLTLVRDLRTAMEIFERSSVAALRGCDGTQPEIASG
jgi:hypothetical protein